MPNTQGIDILNPDIEWYTHSWQRNTDAVTGILSPNPERYDTSIYTIGSEYAPTGEEETVGELTLKIAMPNTNIIQECNILVSIVYANSWVVDDKIYGQLIIKLPYYEEDIDRLKTYLNLKNIAYKEVEIDELERPTSGS